MPATKDSERLKGYKNKGKDQEVSRAFTNNSLTSTLKCEEFPFRLSRR